MLAEIESDIRSLDDLFWFSVDADEARSQDLVACYDSVQGGKQSCTIERSRQFERRRHVVSDAGGVIELIEKPQTLLRPR